MSIRKFVIEGNDFGWEPIADADDRIQFQLAQGVHIECEIKIVDNRAVLVISGHRESGRDQFVVMPRCSNSVMVGF